MMNYNAYSPGFFFVTLEEVRKLELVTAPHKPDYLLSGTKYHNLSQQEMFGRRLVKWEVRELKKHMRRNLWDSAKLLVVYYDGGSIKAKRHNNSQYAKLY